MSRLEANRDFSKSNELVDLFLKYNFGGANSIQTQRSFSSGLKEHSLWKQSDFWNNIKDVSSVVKKLRLPAEITIEICAQRPELHEFLKQYKE